MTTLQQLVQQHLSATNPQFEVPLAPMSYFKIGGAAEVFIEADSRQKIIDVVTFCHQQQVPFRILAGASNVVISSAGVRGVTLSISNETYQVLIKMPNSAPRKTVIRVGAGFRTALLVRKSIDDGLTGLEYYLGVPGKIGGAIYNNAHYDGNLIGQNVLRVEIITPQNEVKWVPAEECEFRYDFSRFRQTHEIILQIEFELAHGNREESLQLVKASTIRRAESQPLGEASSGCYFQNVPNTPELEQRFPQFKDRVEFPAGFLIDQAGLKNAAIGGIKVSQKHAAFFVNTGNGTSDEVKQLAALVKQKVKSLFGVELKEEVFWLE